MLIRDEKSAGISMGIFLLRMFCRKYSLRTVIFYLISVLTILDPFNCFVSHFLHIISLEAEVFLRYLTPFAAYPTTLPLLNDTYLNFFVGNLLTRGLTGAITNFGFRFGNCNRASRI